VLFGAHGIELTWVRVQVRVGLSGEFGADVGTHPGLVELFFLVKETFLFFFGFFLVEAFPLPFV